MSQYQCKNGSLTNQTSIHGNYYKNSYNPTGYRYEDDFVFTTGKRTKKWMAYEQDRKDRLQKPEKKQAQKEEPVEISNQQPTNEPQVAIQHQKNPIQLIEDAVSMISYVSSSNPDVSSLHELHNLPVFNDKLTTIFLRGQFSQSIKKLIIRQLMIKTKCCQKTLLMKLKAKGKWKIQHQTQFCLDCYNPKFTGKQYMLDPKKQTELGQFSLPPQYFTISMMKLQPLCVGGLVKQQCQWLTWYDIASLTTKICTKCTQTHTIKCHFRMEERISEKQ